MREQMSLSGVKSDNRDQITVHVHDMVARVLARAQDKSRDTLCYTMKMPRAVHGKLLSACSRHGITMTDFLLYQIDQALPSMLLAEPARGHKKDRRTVAKRRS